MKKNITTNSHTCLNSRLTRNSLHITQSSLFFLSTFFFFGGVKESAECLASEHFWIFYPSINETNCTSGQKTFFCSTRKQDFNLHSISSIFSRLVYLFAFSKQRPCLNCTHNKNNNNQKKKTPLSVSRLNEKNRKEKKNMIFFYYFTCALEEPMAYSCTTISIETTLETSIRSLHLWMGSYKNFLSLCGELDGARAHTKCTFTLQIPTEKWIFK